MFLCRSVHYWHCGMQCWLLELQWRHGISFVADDPSNRSKPYASCWINNDATVQIEIDVFAFHLSICIVISNLCCLFYFILFYFFYFLFFFNYYLLKSANSFCCTVHINTAFRSTCLTRVQSPNSYILSPVFMPHCLKIGSGALGDAVYSPSQCARLQTGDITTAFSTYLTASSYIFSFIAKAYPGDAGDRCCSVA